MRRSLLLSLLCSLPLWAHGANAPPAPVVWLCGLSEDLVRLECVADQGVQPAVPTPAAPVAMVKGTAFPLDAAQLYRVDLWTPPSDLEFVRVLAQSTICYRSPNCRVVMSGLPFRGLAGEQASSR